MRHNDLRDFTANLLTEVCSNVCREPPLQALIGELLSHDSSNSEDGARLDVSVHVLGVIVISGLLFSDTRFPPKCSLLLKNAATISLPSS